MSAVGIGCKAVMVVRIAVKRMCWANVPTKWRNEHQATDLLIHAYWITVPGKCKQCHQINTMSNVQESTPMLLTVCQCVNNSATNQKDFLWLTKGIFFFVIVHFVFQLLIKAMLEHSTFLRILLDVRSACSQIKTDELISLAISTHETRIHFYSWSRHLHVRTFVLWFGFVWH